MSDHRLNLQVASTFHMTMRNVPPLVKKFFGRERIMLRAERNFAPEDVRCKLLRGTKTNSLMHMVILRKEKSNKVFLRLY